MTDVELAFRSARSQAQAVAAGEISPVELVDNSLIRIADVNDELNAFCFVWDAEARMQAREAADAVVNGAELGPLHGVPIALKDTTPTTGHRTTLGSATHEHWVPDSDAWVVGALRAAGAIVVGKTTSPEFAYNLVTESPLWGVTRNPWDLTRSPGGSSGGSAAAVASGCVALAEGSDMGGSVRIPAAWSGIVGLKPGLGRIPMDALPGLFDQISHHGPLARTVDDARLFLSVTQGPSSADIQSVTTPLDLNRKSVQDPSTLRVGFSPDLGSWAVAPDIAAAVRAAADRLADAGAIVEDVSVVVTRADDELWMQLWGVFMAAYFGDLVGDFADRMDPVVLELIELGNSISAPQYKRLELARSELWHRFAPVFEDHHVLLCPTMSAGPLPASIAAIGLPEAPDDDKLYAHEMTAPFNLLSALPAMSVPVGLDTNQLPIGLQIVGPRWRSDIVLDVGELVEELVPPIGRPPELHES